MSMANYVPLMVKKLLLQYNKHLLATLMPIFYKYTA